MIEFIQVRKKYNNSEVLKGIDLKINKGELVVLIGPSGCGKTTTLKMINRLINKSEGKILIDGKDINETDAINLRRNIGYVIQQTGLFPHMTIKENIGIVASLKKWSEEEIDKKVDEMLELVGLDPVEYKDRYPNELSGGQQQRIGVARAFATNPEVILMDEPFSALDPITRESLQEELYELQQKLKKTIVFVTHDMDEALKLGDRICIMKDGNIVQFDTPEEILKNPEHDFVEEFVGKNRIWNNPEFIKVSDIMIDNPVKANGSRTIVQAIEIMKNHSVDSLLVTDKEKKLVGIVTAKDIRRNIDRKVTLEEIMQQEVVTTDMDSSIIDVLAIMNEKNVGYVPVVDDGNILKGLITKSSLISILSTQFLDTEVEI
ncbi:ABC transporter ATP-binding protein [Clostridium grantii]|uniref:Quaternary amine transport ATP-binding protein n=1 Tax=Clostridium grantii DSM 8605 TaxID=1121316 RepID=A0A1M5XUP4_9CLOT|nr:ABC transporter ATP-binding protein [Clostridium grantii]SHI03258.1 osmoprotectant transport system ATP-binding protein [Clostridium grantii DSM 8605]